MLIHRRIQAYTTGYRWIWRGNKHNEVLILENEEPIMAIWGSTTQSYNTWQQLALLKKQ